MTNSEEPGLVLVDGCNYLPIDKIEVVYDADGQLATYLRRAYRKAGKLIRLSGAKRSRAMILTSSKFMYLVADSPHDIARQMARWYQLTRIRGGREEQADGDTTT